MRTKQEIVENWLPRYTKRALADFTGFILLTNFQKYVEIFAEHFKVPIGCRCQHAKRLRRGNYYHQLRHGECQRSHGDGSAERSEAYGSSLPGSAAV